MSVNKKIFVPSFLFIFSLLISLIFINTAQAQLTISGSKQMSINGTQTLKASGGNGGYSWSLESGGGYFTGSGNSITFTAPGSNANCTNNPKVCVTDSRNQKKCMWIAVSTSNNATIKAYYYTYPLEGNPYPCAICWAHLTYCDSKIWTYKRSNYNCSGEHINDGAAISNAINLTPYGCGFRPWYGCQPPGSETPACIAAEAYAAETQNVGEYIDVRSAEMIDAGCCPAALLPPDETPIPEPEPKKETNDTGNSCPITIPVHSTNNLKSGNLYHFQDVGILSLSYNSIDTTASTLGSKWTHQYNQKLTALNGNATIIFNTEDGNVIYYRLSGGIYYPDAISGDTSTIIKYTNGTFARTTKSKTVYYYNSAGQLTSIVDKNGNATTLTYSGGYLASITDQNGRTTTITSTNGYINFITDPSGRTYTFGYAGGLLTYIADPLGNIWTYTYDSTGRMLSKKDPANFTVTYTYNAAGKIVSSTDPEGLIRSITYPRSGETAFTEKDGGVWTYKYNPLLAAKTEQTDPLGNITRYTYDSKRNLTSTIAPDGSTTSYTYDTASNMTSMTDPLGNVTRYTYNSLNLVATITDPKGGVTSYSYDYKGNPISITDPLGAATSFQYNAKGNITAMIDAKSKTTYFAYDTYNNLTAITDPLGKTTYFTYDTVGNRRTSTDPLGHITYYYYNALNQMIQVTDPRGYSTYYTYDYKGSIVKATNAKGYPTNYAYNYRGNLTQITDALNNITKMAYGPASCGSGCGGADKLSALTDALNHTTAYTYDTAGRMIRETDPQGRIITYEYDANGHMISKTKPDGRTITYYYDEAGRLIERRYPSNMADKFQYDQNGNLLATTNSYIAYYYSYDANNRMTGVVDTNLRNIEYRYDTLGNRTSMITPDGGTTTYRYDAGRKLTSISNNNGSFIFTYDANGRRNQLSYPNGVKATYTYDQNSNLTQVKHASGNKPVTSAKYTYDAINNRISRAETGHAVNYRYDAISRLIESSHQEQYTYDGVGNRLTGPKIVESYTYDAGNELISDKTYSYEYDPNGNLIKQTETRHGNRKHTKVTIYAYDDENRLIEVKMQKQDKAKVVSFIYDPFGRRISKTVEKEDFDDDDDNAKDGDKDKNKNNPHKKDLPRTINYLYDNQAIIAEYNDHGKLTAAYTHGSGIDEPLAANIHHEGRIYYHADALGSIIALTNNHGNKVQDYAYDAFGNMKHHPKWITQPYTYTAREYDSETEFYYYRARYYDPKAGRFITRDPILHPSNGNSKGCRGSNLAYQNGVPTFEELQKNPQNLNPYTYARNNPIRYNDPLGLWCGTGKYEPYIPDNYGAWSFSYPCQMHDSCYETCDKSKTACDIQFYLDMLSVCGRIGGTLSSIGSACTVAASIYFGVVVGSDKAKTSYEDSQKCCKR